MKKMLLISVAALFGIVTAILASSAANAQAVRQAPILERVLTDTAQDSDANVIEVQNRRIRRNRGVVRRGVRRNNRARGRVRNRRRSRRSRRNRGIAAGVAVGIIGTAIIANERAKRRERRGIRRENAHIDWCLDRYRSYSVRSDTYQPFNGRRRRCLSPYN